MFTYSRIGWLLVPLFVLPNWLETYRLVVFRTTPRDTYENLLMWIAGVPGAEILPAPFIFRPLSVLPAWPIFEVAPVVRFSMLPPEDEVFLRAIFALTLVWAVAKVLIGWLCAKLAARWYGASTVAQVGVGIAAWAMAGFGSSGMVDATGTAWAALCLVLMGTPWFAPAMLAAVLVNEKIVIAMAVYTGVRWFLSRSRDDLKLMGWSWLAVVVYAVLSTSAPVVRLESQSSVWMIGSNALTTLRYSLSMKGFMLNVLPVCGLGFIAALGLWSSEKSEDGELRNRAFVGLAVLAALVLASVAAGVEGNVGRIASYSIPWILPGLAVFIDRVLSEFHSVKNEVSSTL